MRTTYARTPTFHVREYRRFPAQCSMYFSSDQVYGTGTIWNLSLGGWRVDSDLAVKRGTAFDTVRDAARSSTSRTGRSGDRMLESRQGIRARDSIDYAEGCGSPKAVRDDARIIYPALCTPSLVSIMPHHGLIPGLSGCNAVIAWSVGIFRMPYMEANGERSERPCNTVIM